MHRFNCKYTSKYIYLSRISNCLRMQREMDSDKRETERYELYIACDAIIISKVYSKSFAWNLDQRITRRKNFVCFAGQTWKFLHALSRQGSLQLLISRDTRLARPRLIRSMEGSKGECYNQKYCESLTWWRLWLLAICSTIRIENFASPRSNSVSLRVSMLRD